MQDKDAPALMRGDAWPAAEKAALAQEIAALPGMPEAFVLQRNLRNEIATFATHLLEAQDGSGGAFRLPVDGHPVPARGGRPTGVRSELRSGAGQLHGVIQTTTCAAS